MEPEYIKEVVEREYNLKVNSIEKIKNVYKMSNNNNTFALKVIKYEFSHFLFILSAIKHLQNNGFSKTPNIIKNKYHKDYIKLNKGYAYLNPWIESRQCNYDKKDDIKMAVTKLAELHKNSRGFKLTDEMRPRVGWGRWIENFQQKREDVLLFKNEINKKKNKTKFDELYLRSIKEEIDRIDKSIEDLSKSEYFSKMDDEAKYKGFCHHDYAHHNILIEKNGDVNIIDFDYCILDTHLHDLSSIIIRVMKNGKWNINNSMLILKWYDSIYPIKNGDIQIMAPFIGFPQAFWQIGIQYYREKQPWSEELFENKIRKVYKDKNKRQKFVDDFKNINY